MWQGIGNISTCLPSFLVHYHDVENNSSKPPFENQMVSPTQRTLFILGLPILGHFHKPSLQSPVQGLTQVHLLENLAHQKLNHLLQPSLPP